MSKFKVVTEHDRKVLKRKLIVGGTVAVGAGLYILHRRKIDEVITLHQQSVEWTMDESFEAGVKYGLQLAKDIFDGDAFAKQDAAKYAFGAFDKAS